MNDLVRLGVWRRLPPAGEHPFLWDQLDESDEWDEDADYDEDEDEDGSASASAYGLVYI